MNLMADSNSSCAICGGVEADHKTSQHMFTTTPGQLVTKEQHEKEQPKQVTIPYQGGPLGKLIEVLVIKKLMTLEEALYVAELGPRPDLSRYEGDTVSW